jgi:1-acyl-sn-glycerol-3-phosphate acyltransferase
MSPFYALCRTLILILLHVLWRFRVRGVEHIPLKGGVIVAANHVSVFDPPALGCALPRQLTYMAKSELFRNPLFGRLILALGAYPIERGRGDVGAIKRSVALLREGRALAMFPEGTRNFEGKRGAQAGAALLAGLAGVPIVPAYIGGTDGAARLARITVTFGAPLQVERSQKASREELAKLTDEVMGRIRALKEDSSSKRVVA